MDLPQKKYRRRYPNSLLSTLLFLWGFWALSENLVGCVSRSPNQAESDLEDPDALLIFRPGSTPSEDARSAKSLFKENGKETVDSLLQTSLQEVDLSHQSFFRWLPAKVQMEDLQKYLEKSSSTSQNREWEDSDNPFGKGLMMTNDPRQAPGQGPKLLVVKLNPLPKTWVYLPNSPFGQETSALALQNQEYYIHLQKLKFHQPDSLVFSSLSEDSSPQSLQVVSFTGKDINWNESHLFDIRESKNMSVASLQANSPNGNLPRSVLGIGIHFPLLQDYFEDPQAFWDIKSQPSDFAILAAMHSEILFQKKQAAAIWKPLAKQIDGEKEHFCASAMEAAHHLSLDGGNLYYLPCKLQLRRWLENALDNELMESPRYPSDPEVLSQISELLVRLKYLPENHKSQSLTELSRFLIQEWRSKSGNVENLTGALNFYKELKMNLDSDQDIKKLRF